MMVLESNTKITGFAGGNTEVKMPGNMLQTSASDGSDVMFIEYSKRQMGCEENSAATLPQKLMETNFS